MFYKDLFDKLDIDVQIIRHGKFKSAVEPFMLNKMSIENREQIKLLLNSFSNNLMDSIANQRNLSLQTVQNHADNLSLNSAKDCRKLKYVDELLYQDQVEKILLEISDNAKLNTISLNNYSKVSSNKKKKISKNKIAIIYATGAINSGKGDENSIGSATTVKAIRKAKKDKNVKGIVFRINSGGGSALASDVILREVLLAKKEKPFIVSLGDYAASGGYYIACAADSIIANPTTLTGSIGVFGMIPNLKSFYKNKLGINIDTVNTNKYSDIGINRKLSEFEKNKIQMQIEDIYDTFITRVSEGRSIEKSEVDKIGQGRVWSGYDAKKIGLVDIYGGLETAINITASIAEVKDYRIISLPKKQDPIERLFNDIDQKSQIKKYVIEKLGVNSSLIPPIEILIEDEKIQARIPYSIRLK
jgi:protease-4